MHFKKGEVTGFWNQSTGTHCTIAIIRYISCIENLRCNGRLKTESWMQLKGHCTHGNKNIDFSKISTPKLLKQNTKILKPISELVSIFSNHDSYHNKMMMFVTFWQKSTQFTCFIFLCKIFLKFYRRITVDKQIPKFHANKFIHIKPIFQPSAIFWTTFQILICFCFIDCFLLTYGIIKKLLISSIVFLTLHDSVRKMLLEKKNMNQE
jgi:hypothetical protein